MMTTPLVTLTELKDFIGIRPTNTEHDGRLALLAQSSTLELEQATHRTFTRAVMEELFDTATTTFYSYDLQGSGDSGVIGRSRPQIFNLSGILPVSASGIEVFYDPERLFDTDTLIAAADYHIDWNTSVLTLFRGTYTHTAALKAIYTAGIVVADGTLSATAPANLKMACLYQSAFMFKRLRADNIGHSGDAGLITEKTKIGVASWNVQQGLCQEAQGLIREYKMPLMGRG